MRSIRCWHRPKALSQIYDGKWHRHWHSWHSARYTILPRFPYFAAPACIKNGRVLSWAFLNLFTSIPQPSVTFHWHLEFYFCVISIGRESIVRMNCNLPFECLHWKCVNVSSPCSTPRYSLQYLPALLNRRKIFRKLMNANCKIDISTLNSLETEWETSHMKWHWRILHFFSVNKATQNIFMWLSALSIGNGGKRTKKIERKNKPGTKNLWFSAQISNCTNC